MNNTDSAQNITQVNITLPAGFGFIAASNGTSASSTNFTNTAITAIWSNTTASGFITNGTTQYFWLNASVPSAGGNYSFNISTLDTAGAASSALVTVFADNGTVSECRNLAIPGMYYTLTQNVSAAGTCFNVLADNVTLDGAGYWVNYSQSAAGNAVNNSGGYDNITIKNLNIVQGSTQTYAYAIYGIGMQYSTIQNNNITTSGGVGTYNITWFLNETLNAQNKSDIVNYIISPDGISITLSPSTQTIIYGNSLTRYCSDNSTGFNCELFLNGANITAKNSTAEVFVRQKKPFLIMKFISYCGFPRSLL